MRVSWIAAILACASHAAVEWHEVSGGETDRKSSKCSPRSHHGYLGQDVEVVGVIADYIHKH